MTEQKNEEQLADKARIALLNAVIQAAETKRGEAAKEFAEAYAIINSAAPSDAGAPGPNVSSYEIPLTGRR